MLQRLRATGLNLLVLLISLLVFLVSFGGLSYFAASARPPQRAVLAAARDLAMGEVIAPGDLVEKHVYLDENASLYIPAEERGGVVGGVAALPVSAGHSRASGRADVSCAHPGAAGQSVALPNPDAGRGS